MSPGRSVSNFDTDSTTNDWDREAKYGNQQRSTSDRDIKGLYVTFGGVVDSKSSELKLIAPFTAEFINRLMIDPCNGMSGCLGGAQRMAWFGFCFLSSVLCLFFQWLSV